MQPSATLAPRVSVIVTTYNRPKRLERMLQALTRQDLPYGEFEVVVVDDGSPEPVAPVLDGFTDRLRITHRRQPNSGPAVGRNTAIALAKSRFIVMLDDDCEPEPAWLPILLEALEANPDAMVGGHTVNGLRTTPIRSQPNDRDRATPSTMQTRQRTFSRAATGGILTRPPCFDADYRLAGGEDRGLSDRWRLADTR